jgi:hypothetical protein
MTYSIIPQARREGRSAEKTPTSHRCPLVSK